MNPTRDAGRTSGDHDHESVDRTEPLRVAMALYGDITYDSRVQREAESLSNAGFAVTIYCLAGSVPTSVPYAVRIAVPHASDVLPIGSDRSDRGSSTSRLGRVIYRAKWVVGYARNLRSWGRWAVRDAADIDVWHAHDLPGLMAIAPVLGTSQQLVYDSHEIFLESSAADRLPGSLRRLLQLYEKRLARRATALVTVNDGYARVLRERLDPRRIVLVRNCPPRREATTSESSPLRTQTDLPATAPVVLYHGILSPSRGIIQMADAITRPGLEDVHAAALGFGIWVDDLKQAAREPKYGGRFHVVPAVAPSELLDWVAGADVDVIALQHSSLNHYLCTPNKLWESIAAGVPVVVSDFPEMRRIVLDEADEPLGAVCDPTDPTSIAAAIQQILGASQEDRSALRERCLRAARQRWNWETESARLVELYEGLQASR